MVNGRLLLGEDDVLAVPGVPDQPVYVGVRPEGFVVDPQGPMRCRLNRVEVMGRDTSIISAHPAAGDVQLRSIVPSETRLPEGAETVRFSLKPAKVFLFSKADETRLRTGESEA